VWYLIIFTVGEFQENRTLLSVSERAERAGVNVESSCEADPRSDQIVSLTLLGDCRGKVRERIELRTLSEY